MSCRLKDITDIFIDTGSGARSHSIIGQGSVEKLITAKPEEKRTLIEEVAGIRKYKIRRRETETRIKTTKENLSRIGDMTNEVKRQMDTLSQQARQAEEFRGLSEETSKLESTILNTKLYKLEKRKNTILGDLFVRGEIDLKIDREQVDHLLTNGRIVVSTATDRPIHHHTDRDGLLLRARVCAKEQCGNTRDQDGRRNPHDVGGYTTNEEMTITASKAMVT